MHIPEHLKYTNEHHWVRIDEDKIYIGITDYGKNKLGDIVFIDVPENGTIVAAGDVMGSLESVQEVEDIYAPISGEILEINDELADAPEELNEAPYENWIMVMSISDESELENLMDAEEYIAYCSTL